MDFKKAFDFFNNMVWFKTKDKEIMNRKPYNLELPELNGFESAKNKVLVIIGFVPTLDLKEKALLGDKVTLETYSNVFNYAFHYATLHKKLKPKDWSFSFISFNYFKWYDLDKTQKDRAEYEATERIKRYIDKIKPTHLLIMGDNVARRILEVEDIHRYRGWLHNYKSIPCVNTIDIDQSFNVDKYGDLDDNAIDHANILGYVSRNIATLFLKGNPYFIEEVKPKSILVKTIKQFDKLMKTLDKSKVIAVDTEGTSLETMENKLATIQFAITSQEGYIIPYYHQDSPWTPKEFKYIKKKLRKFFSKKVKPYQGTKTKYIIGQNFGYDIRILMKELNIRYWYWNTWDLMAGEQLLDENIKVLRSYSGQGHYGLEQMSLNYGNDFYLKTDFGKAQRTLIANMELTQDVLDYTTMDVQLMIAIQKQQLRRASNIEHIKGNSYLKDYHKLMLTQLNSMTRVMSIMKYRGNTIDVPYLLSLANPDSDISKAIEYNRSKLYSLKEVKKASKIINSNKGAPENSLFGQSYIAFDYNKKDHIKTLFLDVLKLEPLSYGKSGEPSFDKFFLKEYAEKHESAKILLELSKLEKLKTAYVDSYFKSVEESHDGRIDKRIRADFGYIGVVTGRSNSSNPNFQQIPEHSAEAKLIKRMFITPPMTLPYEADYSAHEVRCWGITADDDNIRQSFNNIHNLIIKYRRNPTKKNLERKETEGDPHKQNYNSFTGVALKDVTKEMRQDAKVITFGSIYGKSINSLAKDTKKSKEETQKIYDSFFKRFHKGKQWLDASVNQAKKKMFANSPTGRRRNLFGVLSGHNAMKAAVQRRAQNSPVQGFGSDIGFMASDIYSRTMHELLKELDVKHKNSKLVTNKKYTYLPTGPNVMIHDSIKCEMPFEYYLLGMHILEWAMTNGVTDYLRETHGIITGVPFDIEFSLGSCWKDKEAWNFSEKHLYELIEMSLKGHKLIYPDDKRVQSYDVKETLEYMKDCYADQCKKLDLHRRFPLNVN